MAGPAITDRKAHAMQPTAFDAADKLAELQILDALHHSVLAARLLRPEEVEAPLIDEIADRLLARRRELREALAGSRFVFRRIGGEVFATPAAA